MSRFEQLNIFKKREKKSSQVEFPGMWKIDIGDVNSFSQLWSMKITTARLVGIIVFAVVVIVVIGVTVIIATPLRSILPGYLGNGVRSEYEAMAFRVDSLTAVVDYQNDYLNNISAIFNEDVTDVEIAESHVADSVGLIPVDSLLPTSESERRFMKQYEQREKHNLSVLSPIAAEGMTFYKPVASGVVDDAESGTVSGNAGGLNLIVGSGARVSSIYRGTVVATWFDPLSGGISVMVQHPRDFMSVYSGMESVYVNKGDKVNSGSPVGVAGRQKPRLLFELWHNGSLLNPLDYIAF